MCTAPHPWPLLPPCPINNECFSLCQIEQRLNPATRLCARVRARPHAHHCTLLPQKPIFFVKKRVKHYCFRLFSVMSSFVILIATQNSCLTFLQRLLACGCWTARRLDGGGGLVGWPTAFIQLVRYRRMFFPARVTVELLPDPQHLSCLLLRFELGQRTHTHLQINTHGPITRSSNHVSQSALLLNSASHIYQCVRRKMQLWQLQRLWV